MWFLGHWWWRAGSQQRICWEAQRQTNQSNFLQHSAVFKIDDLALDFPFSQITIFHQRFPLPLLNLKMRWFSVVQTRGEQQIADEIQRELQGSICWLQMKPETIWNEGTICPSCMKQVLESPSDFPTKIIWGQPITYRVSVVCVPACAHVYIYCERGVQFKQNLFC